MFEVKVTIEIPGLPEAINMLAQAMQGSSCHCTNETPGTQAPVTVTYPNIAPTQQIPVPDNRAIANPSTAGASSVSAPTPAVAPAAPVAVAAPSPAVEAPSAPAPAPTAYTMDDLGRAGATLIDAGKMPQLIALLGKFGVQAVTQLKAEQFAAFADELKALGAKF